MKNILFILIACLMVTLVKAAPAVDNGGMINKRDLMVRFYSQQKRNIEIGEKFLSAVKKGDVKTIEEMETLAKNPAYLMARDKFGNNAFHLAKDASTLQAVARSIRNLYKDDFPAKILALKNQPNVSGVIPAVQAVFDLSPDKFFVLLEQSDLQLAILKAKSMSAGGALEVAAAVEQGKVRDGMQLADGFTAADFARANRNIEGMDKVVAYFADNTPYL